MSVLKSAICSILFSSWQIRKITYVLLITKYQKHQSFNKADCVKNPEKRFKVYSIFNHLPLKNILHQIPTLVFVTITVYQVFVYLHISAVIYIFSHFELSPSKCSLNSSKLPINFWNIFPYLLLWSYLTFQKSLE